jgi:hypothetical protein
MVKNLWGDLSSLAVVRTPKIILEEQASLLAEATEGVLVGMVVGGPSSIDSFEYGLLAVVPALNNFRYQILRVYHSLEMYPLNVYSDRPPVNERFETEAEFESAVAKILSSPEVRLVLSKLKSQVAMP